jgi:hypothetical protein
MFMACSTNGGGGREMYLDYRCEILNERDHYETQNVHGWIRLRWILERYGVVWTSLI